MQEEIMMLKSIVMMFENGKHKIVGGLLVGSAGLGAAIFGFTMVAVGIVEERLKEANNE